MTWSINLGVLDVEVCDVRVVGVDGSEDGSNRTRGGEEIVRAVEQLLMEKNSKVDRNRAKVRRCGDDL